MTSRMKKGKRNWKKGIRDWPARLLVAHLTSLKVDDPQTNAMSLLSQRP
jgi:hypothetical protein